MEVEDVASTDTMVGAKGANVCVMPGKYMMGNVDQSVLKYHRVIRFNQTIR